MKITETNYPLLWASLCTIKSEWPHDINPVVFAWGGEPYGDCLDEAKDVEEMLAELEPEQRTYFFANGDSPEAVAMFDKANEITYGAGSTDTFTKMVNTIPQCLAFGKPELG